LHRPDEGFIILDEIYGVAIKQWVGSASEVPDMGAAVPFLLGAVTVIVLFRSRNRVHPARNIAPAERQQPASWHSHDRRRAPRRVGRPTAVTIVDLGYRVASQRGFVMDRSAVGLRLALSGQVTLGAMIQIRSVGAADDTPWVSAVVRNGRFVGDYFEVGCEFERQPTGAVPLAQFG